MKPNIDLTQNRDFSDTPSFMELFYRIKRSMYKYPWRASDDFSQTNKKEIIFTGNKKERSRKREFRLYEQEKCCERCGYDASNKPWKMKTGLCIPCYQELEEEVRQKDNFLIRKLQLK